MEKIDPNSSKVKLTDIDILGNEIKILVNENHTGGSYEVSWNGGEFPSGQYFYRININGKISGIKKMIPVK